ncbi:MAG: hypothetical protein IH874_09465 [Candidatus Dadabacteria bacterium]|nr:hypothetical protein [Candidatus Dadabacteria bacterium]
MRLLPFYVVVIDWVVGKLLYFHGRKPRTGEHLRGKLLTPHRSESLPVLAERDTDMQWRHEMV